MDLTSRNQTETSSPLLAVEALGVAFGAVPVVAGVSFTVARGEAVALVGESGCGKSMTARALLRLLPPSAHITGQIHIEGVDVLAASPGDLRRLRGTRTGFVFQDPGQALNPVHPVGEQVAERLRLYSGLSRAAAAARAIELFAELGISDPAARARAYPHQLSGGMRQRVVLAIALACSPALLIADETTTALDVTLQAQIMALIRARQRAADLGLLLITHDLGVVAQAVDRVLVMYAGQIVEAAPVAELFDQPRHPYTRGLLQSMPGAAPVGARLFSIPGQVPSPGAWPPGCRFGARCDRVQAQCATPVALAGAGAHRYRCVNPVPAP